VFIKPIPCYLFCREFWEYIGQADTSVWKAAAGFMRTYCYLIRHEVDFPRANNPDLQLILLVDDQVLTFDSFVRFISQFQMLDNSQVSPRFSYGTLQLTRLNNMAPFCMGKLTYFHIQSQWTDYLGTFITPVVTLFGSSQLS
jgi:hypothetical protein